MGAEWPLIFTYHHITDGRPSRYVYPIARFERGLSRLLDLGYEPATLDEAVAAAPWGPESPRERTFTITFDDALASFARLAFPALERLGIVRYVTMFVPTRWVGASNDWHDAPTMLQRLMPWSDIPEALLTWSDIEDLARAGVSFQSHGHRHAPMQRLTHHEVLEDVRTSMAVLGEHGIRARYLALPYGWRSEEAKAAIRDAGFEAAFSVKWGGRDRYEIRRVPMYGTDSALMLRFKTSGRYFDMFDVAATLTGRGRRPDS